MFYKTPYVYGSYILCCLGNQSSEAKEWQDGLWIFPDISFPNFLVQECYVEYINFN